MNAEDFERIELLKRQIESSQGWKIEMGIRDVERSRYIFMVNYNHLKKALEVFNSDVGLKLWDIRNRDKMDLFQMEIIRMFHNYLASVKSLVDHTRNIVKEIHGNNEYSKEYHEKIEELFVNSKLSRFLQEFRNFILHNGIPIIGAQMTPNVSMDSKITSSIILDLSSLRSWSGWKAKSKEYLCEAKGDINMYEIIVAYESIITDFYNWFSRRQWELFQNELDQTQKIKDEYNKILLKYKLPYE
jgi:hypothetical protein